MAIREAINSFLRSSLGGAGGPKHNDNMGQRRLLVILLIVATALVDLGIAGPFLDFGVPDSGGVDRRFFVFLGLAVSQVNLLAALCAWTTIPVSWGLAGIVLTSACLSRLGGSFAGVNLERNRTIAAVVLLTSAVMAIALTSILRIVGLRIVTMRASGTLNDQAERPRFQFTLGRMFAWITSTAVILGVVRYTMDYQTIRKYAWWAELIEICLIHSSLAVIAVWAVLAADYRVRRILLFSLATLLALIVVGRQLWNDFRMASFFILPQFAWLLAATRVLRVAGYRLVRRGALVESAPPAADA